MDDTPRNRALTSCLLGIAALIPTCQAAAQAGPHTVAIVLYEGFELLDAMGPAEVFTHVGAMRRIDDRPAVKVLLAAPRAGPVRSQNGVRVMADLGLAECTSADLVLVPGGAAAALQRDAKSLAELRRLVADAEIAMSVCNGAFVFAEMGLLDGRWATTHQSLLEALARRFPDIEVRNERVVHDTAGTPRLLTTAGVSAGIDGALAVIDLWFGAELTQHVRDCIEWPLAPAVRPRDHRVDDSHRLPGEGRLLAACEALGEPAALESPSAIARVFGWLQLALDEGYSRPESFLNQPALAPLLADPELRVRLGRLVRDHVTANDATITGADTTSPRLLARLRLMRSEGQPAAGALVFVCHADRNGYYAPEADGPGSGERNPRWFAWLRADLEGRITIHTTLPGAYGSGPPHFHLSVSPDGTADGPRTGGSLYFERDWPIDDEVRSDAAAGVAWLLPVTAGVDSLEVVGELELRP